MSHSLNRLECLGFFFLLLGIKSAMKLGQNQEKKESILELPKFSIEIFILSLISHYMRCISCLCTD